jgi:glycosyltransferase involved in cell wall biosynthesis
MDALSKALAGRGDIQLGVAARIPKGDYSKLTMDGITHFAVPSPPKGFNLLRPTDGMILLYKNIVEQFLPDVIHVHGTEWYGGLVTSHNNLSRPSVVSLQGLLDVYAHHVTSDLKFADIMKSRTLRNWLRFDGLWEQKKQWNKRAAVEREIIEGHQSFIGRTQWDRAHLRRLKPEAHYYHCHEVVRSEFFDQQWQLPSAKRHSVFAPSAMYPIKGFHVLVRAAAILRREFPEISVRVPLASFPDPGAPGWLYARLRRSDYAIYLAKLIDHLGVRKQIKPLGELSAKEMADEMCRAHVFTLNSFIENSPNSMAESLVLGVPSIVTFVGGVPSLITDGRSALGYPSGDESILAEQIRRIFYDDALALRLSYAGKEMARHRYSPAPIAGRMVQIYTAVLQGTYSRLLEEPE